MRQRVRSHKSKASRARSAAKRNAIRAEVSEIFVKTFGLLGAYRLFTDLERIVLPDSQGRVYLRKKRFFTFVRRVQVGEYQLNQPLLKQKDIAKKLKISAKTVKNDMAWLGWFYRRNNKTQKQVEDLENLVEIYNTIGRYFLKGRQD